MIYERIQGNDMYNGAVNPPGDPNPTLNGVSLRIRALSCRSSTPVQHITAATLPSTSSRSHRNRDELQVSGELPVQHAGVQQSVGTHAVLSSSYVGSQGRHENYYQAINLPQIGDIPAAQHGRTQRSPTKLAVSSASAASSWLKTRANAKYNSLQTSLNGTVYRDLHLQVSYTLSKAEDSTTSTGSGGDLNNATNPYRRVEVRLRTFSCSTEGTSSSPTSCTTPGFPEQSQRFG